MSLARRPLAALVALALAAAVRAGEKPVVLPPALAEALNAAQAALAAEQPQKALDGLLAFEGDDHALRHLLLGHAHARLGKLDPAAAAYRKALAMDAALAPAGLGLAQVCARQERWRQAADLLGRFADADACPADLLLLYAEAARQLDDRRLWGLLAEKGIVRFPADGRFRRLDLALRLGEGDHQAAARALHLLLRQSPAEPELWQQLAYVRQQAGDGAGALAALEASLLAGPDDLARHRRLLGARLADGDWRSVVRHGQALLAGPLAEAAAADAGLLDLLVSAADMGEDDATLAAWLARVGEGRRTRSMRLAAARLALRRGEADKARDALRRLIEGGQADAAAFLWAGHLAEDAKDWPAAESLYGQARRGEGRSARLAALYLARLRSRLGRHEPAAQLLREYLDRWPEDAAARSLLRLVERRAGAAP